MAKNNDPKFLQVMRKEFEAQLIAVNVVSMLNTPPDEIEIDIRKGNTVSKMVVPAIKGKPLNYPLAKSEDDPSKKLAKENYWTKIIARSRRTLERLSLYKDDSFFYIVDSDYITLKKSIEENLKALNNYYGFKGDSIDGSPFILKLDAINFPSVPNEEHVLFQRANPNDVVKDVSVPNKEHVLFDELLKKYSELANKIYSQARRELLNTQDSSAISFYRNTKNHLFFSDLSQFAEDNGMDISHYNSYSQRTLHWWYYRIAHITMNTDVLSFKENGINFSKGNLKGRVKEGLLNVIERAEKVNKLINDADIVEWIEKLKEAKQWLDVYETNNTLKSLSTKISALMDISLNSDTKISISRLSKEVELLSKLYPFTEELPSISKLNISLTVESLSNLKTELLKVNVFSKEAASASSIPQTMTEVLRYTDDLINNLKSKSK